MKNPSNNIDSQPRTSERTRILPRQRFMIGKYEVRSEPLPGAVHMQRYTVFSRGRRVGTTVSRPTESDCNFLDNPPPVPPLKFFSYKSRGRPKKVASPPSSVVAVLEAKSYTVPREDLPDRVTLLRGVFES